MHFKAGENPPRTGCGRQIVTREGGPDPQRWTTVPELVDCRSCLSYLRFGQPKTHSQIKQAIIRDEAIRLADIELRLRHQEEYGEIVRGFLHEQRDKIRTRSSWGDRRVLVLQGAPVYHEHMTCPVCWSALSLRHLLTVLGIPDYTEEAIEMFRRESTRQRRALDSRVARALDHFADDLD